MRTASSLLKHRILEALGFTVIRVPYQEWSQCGTREKRLRYVGSFWKQLIDAKVVTEDTAKDVALGDVLEVAVSAECDEVVSQRERAAVRLLTARVLNQLTMSFNGSHDS
ncbi:hypothetical protein FOZ62_019708 [Perkinsus olseni]|uniref:RAP domain-containing protein n=1 Tax=Perkinsus olseni TaxID=32597 RepID=A0A7J6S5E8_PEROL|nr:hypothetical protein FOZ62_019708 [Perkinsus olseni]